MISRSRRRLVEVLATVASGRLGLGPLVLRQLGLAALFIGLAVLAGCTTVDHYPQTALDPVTEYGRKQQELWDTILRWAWFVFIVVEALLLYTIWRFRHRPGNPRPRQIHGHTKLEIGWTIAPSIVLAAIAVPTVVTIFEIGGPAPRNAITVDVIGHQWWWEFRYRDLNIVTANELYMPVGQYMDLQLSSADVIHAFWLPRIGGKRDTNPNRNQNIWFDTPREPDVFIGQCGEYCGTSHANMRAKGFAVSQADWETWVRTQQQPAAVTTGRGAELFNQRGCAGCHVVGGVSNPPNPIGPNLTHFGSRTSLASAIYPNDREHLAAWLDDPPAMKPGSLMPKLGLSQEDIATLVEYLESLK